MTLHEKGDTLAQTQVFGGETDRAELVAESTVTAYLLPGEQDRLRRVRYGEKFCYAPVVRAAAAGTVEYRLGDAVIASDRLKYGGEVLLAQEKRGLLDRLRQRLANGRIFCARCTISALFAGGKLPRVPLQHQYGRERQGLYLLYRRTPSRENGLPERPQTLRQSEIIKFSSAEDAQSSAARSSDHFFFSCSSNPSRGVM